MTTKRIKQVISGSPVDMGGLITRQPLPSGRVQQLDPFLLLHHTGPTQFEPGNRGLPFAPHPHKGFETVTFIFDGAVEHKDSTGIKSTIKKGGVQWMTAGRGIVHSENLPYEMQEKGATVEYIQIWINLPSRLKNTPAKYHGVQANEIPELTLANSMGKVRIISGSYDTITGPMKSLTGVHAFELYLQPEAELDIPVSSGHQVLFYILEGSAIVDSSAIEMHQLARFEDNGDNIHIKVKDFTRIILCTGAPIGEPVVSHGPFVMNTQSEIMAAIRDYQMGKMGMVID
jgi:quercetin 2,3-dioxygenase